ncbi:hypothetical protein [Actinokineospora inagensis]|uniref:hypothetical protein n=1 Tax=Actinokineospora inagensis TaxID=103730 RepID=UPI0003F4E632|nr:hypothetical protein [Actinokineospora inagensis]
MTDQIAFAHSVAEAVLHRFGPLTPPWQILAADLDTNVFPSPFLPTSVAVTLGNGRKPEIALYPLITDTETAVTELAGQIQDHVIESTGGLALPRCPGHQHPMTARVDNGTAYWLCPANPTHHREPIIPT